MIISNSHDYTCNREQTLISLQDVLSTCIIQTHVLSYFEDLPCFIVFHALLPTSRQVICNYPCNPVVSDEILTKAASLIRAFYTVLYSTIILLSIISKLFFLLQLHNIMR